MRRNRRILQGSVAIAGVAVIATVAGIGLRGGLFDNTSPPVKQIQVQQLVPSNPRAFAAAVAPSVVTSVVGGVDRQEELPPMIGCARRAAREVDR